MNSEKGKHHRERDTKNSKKSFRQNWRDEPAATKVGIYVNVLLFVAAAAAAIFTYQQVAISRRAFISGQRAWLVIDDASIRFTPPLIAAGMPTIVEFSFTNTGHLPATIRRITVRAVERNSPIPLQNPFFDDQPSRDPIPFKFGETVSTPVVGPNGMIATQHPIPPFKPDLVESIKARRWFLFVHARVLYDDGFGDDAETSTCLVYRAEGGFSYCGSQNWVK